MRTQLLGRPPIDQIRLQEDIDRSAEFRFGEAYAEFSCGRPWKSCMLWAAGGEVGDNVIAHYDTSRPSGPTEYGKRLPYVRELIEQYFSVQHLVFARLAVMSDSVLIPHRDYVEFDEEPKEGQVQHRLHVSLVTSEDCYFSEDDQIFRMRPGEVWFLDATRVHSAAVLSGIQRAHLILDFTDAGSAADLVRMPIEEPPGVPAKSVVPRRPLSDQEKNELLALASIVDEDNLMDVFSIVVKKHYRRDGGLDFFWKTVSRIGELSENEAVRKKIPELHQYYMLERDE